MRVYELAKELNMDSKEIMQILGEEYKSTSLLEETDIAKVKDAKKAIAERKAQRAQEKKTDAQKAASETAPEKKQAEAPKKKKPVLLFRPENSSFGQKNGQNTRGNNGNGQNRRKNDDRQGNRVPREERQEKRSVIKPSVPTTAEMYKENVREVPVKEKTAVESAPVEEKQTAPAQEIPVQEIPVQEAPVQKAEVKEAPAQEAAAQKENVKEPVQEENKPAEETAPAQEQPAKQPAPKTAPAKTAPAQEPAKKKTIPVFKFEKPVENVYEKMRKQEEEKKARQAAERANGGNQQSGNGERRPYNNGERRPYNGDRRNGNQQGGNGFNRNGQNGYSSRGSGQQGGNGFNRNGQNGGRTFNKDGQQNSNRGMFSKAPGAKFEKRDSAAGDTSLFTSAKGEVRSKKNVKTDKDRGNVDRTGKKAENFRNLSKDYNQNKKPIQKKEEEVIKMITLPAVITIKELAEKMKQKPADVIKKLFLQGKMMTVNTEVSYEEAEEIAMEYSILCEQEVQVDVIEELLKEEEESEDLMVKRPPVVCVMGHVDHGKTSLLDKIRSTNVTAREAGGITQHIGAYMVECNGEPITFLDTPGHEAFTAMRMRGAQATDIAVLVVAADDGVKPQTVEAINHAKAAGVDVIVAINKIDKPAANIEHVKQELTNYELIAEDWGGQTPMVPVSAKTGEGIDQLLEMILLVAEVKELKANPNREMRGIVIEAKLDKGRGPVATVLIQKGTMKAGDFVSAGSFYGRVRAMLNAEGKNLKSAGPATPVEILGLNGVPNAGEVCIGHKNEKDARAYADTFIAEEKKKMLADTKAKLTMDSLFDQIQAGNIKELPIVVKADVQGSVEAVRTSLEKLSNEEVQVKVIHGGVGAINESDVTLASASNALIIGFNIKPDAQAKQLADSEHVDMRLYRVIYQAIDDVEAAMKGMLAPVYEEKILGHAEIRQTFKASGVGTIAGSYVLDGTFERGCSARITRDKEQIFDGAVASLKRFKDDVKEVREGFECGIVFEKFNDLQEGDLVEAYKMVQVERT